MDEENWSSNFRLNWTRPHTKAPVSLSFVLDIEYICYKAFLARHGAEPLKGAAPSGTTCAANFVTVPPFATQGRIESARYISGNHGVCKDQTQSDVVSCRIRWMAKLSSQPGLSCPRPRCKFLQRSAEAKCQPSVRGCRGKQPEPA
jgi:hypothetical protein